MFKFLRVDCMTKLLEAIDVKRRNWFVSWSILRLKWRERVQGVLPCQSISTNPEHGVGMVKKDYLVQELGLETVELMRRIKVPIFSLLQIDM